VRGDTLPNGLGGTQSQRTEFYWLQQNPLFRVMKMTVDLEAAAANQREEEEEEEEEEEDGEEAAAARDGDSDGESSRTQLSIPESKPVCLCQQFQHNTFLRKLEAEAKVQFDW
jgi:hypothetical protein